MTSFFPFKQKYMRHMSLYIVYGQALGPGVQLAMVMVMWPTDHSERSVGRDFIRKGCEQASNNSHL